MLTCAFLAKEKVSESLGALLTLTNGLDSCAIGFVARKSFRMLSIRVMA